MKTQNLLVIYFLTLGLATAQAADRQILSTGIVFPSDNSALFENPAALRNSATSPKVLFGFGDKTRAIAAQGSMVGAVGLVGVGAAATTLNDQWYGTLGAGVDLLGTGIGGQITNNFDTNSPVFDLALQYGGKRGLSAAVVVRDLSNGIEEVDGGVGVSAGEILLIEGDLEWLTESDDIFMNPGIGIQIPTTALSLAAGYRFKLIDGDGGPNGQAQFRAGAGCSLGATAPIAIEFLYEFFFEEFIVGATFEL